jgi:sporulation protein YpjB
MPILLQFKRMIFIFIIMFVTLNGCSSPVESTEQAAEEREYVKLDKLNRIADEMYLKTQDEHIEEARVELIRLSELLTEIRYQGITSLEGVQALTQTVIEAKAVFSAVEFSMEEGLMVSAKLRLAADALTHPKNPMWLQYYKVLKQDGIELALAVEKDQPDLIKQGLAKIAGHYSLIKPAVVITRDPSEARKMDSFLVFLNKETSVEALKQYESLLKELFHREESTTYLPVSDQNPVLWSLAIGSIIITVLIYAGWRRFQYERDYIAVQKQRYREREY